MNSTRIQPEVAAGLWRLPTWELDNGALAAWTAGVLDLGVDLFDLADIYGGYTVEESFGEALRAAPGLRDRLRILTKCDIKLPNARRPAHTSHVYDTSAEHIIASVENSLRVLGTDRLDVLLLHRQDPLMDPDEVTSAAVQLVESGKVLAFGVSNFTPSHLAALASRVDGTPAGPLWTNQVEASILRLDPFTDGTLDQALERRIRPMAWSPLGGGALFTGAGERETRVRAALARVGAEAGLEPDAVAFAFLARHPAGIISVTGTRKLERIARARAATEVTLSREQWFDLWTASTGERLP